MRMPSTSWFVALAIILLLPGCEFLPGGGGGGTGGGGGSMFTFDKGFAYTRRDDRNVYLADESDTQTSTTLTQSGNVRTPSFSADGKQIVFVRGTTMESEIAIVPTAGGLITSVISSSAMQRNLKTPVLSPNGTQVAFGFDDGTSTRIGLINVDGTNARTLPSGGLAQAYPSFTPDGSGLIVAAGSPGLGYTQIERITLATDQVTNVTNVLGNEAMNISNRLIISPDGTKAAFDGTVSTGETRLFVIDLGSKVVTRPYAGEPGTNDTFPCWIGTSALAFSSDSGGNDNVYRVNLPVSTSPSLLVPKAIEPFYAIVAQ
jgi:Tol biopolymer transport system component